MRFTTRVAMLVLAALFAAGCGGTDDSEATSTQPSVETTSTTSTPATTTSAPTTTAPPPTTTEPPTTTSAAPTGSPEDDVAVVEALVAAWYGNDFETVSQLLDPLWSPDPGVTWTLDDVRRQMEYASALESRVDSFVCYPPGERGQSFWCQYAVGTFVTDAMEWGVDSETLMEEVVVIDGRVTNWVHDNFGYPNEGVADFLEATEQAEALAAWFDGGCSNAGPMLDVAGCVEMLLQHLDDYVEWFADNG